MVGWNTIISKFMGYIMPKYCQVGQLTHSLLKYDNKPRLIVLSFAILINLYIYNICVLW